MMFDFIFVGDGATYIIRPEHAALLADTIGEATTRFDDDETFQRMIRALNRDGYKVAVVDQVRAREVAI